MMLNALASSFGIKCFSLELWCQMHPSITMISTAWVSIYDVKCSSLQIWCQILQSLVIKTAGFWRSLKRRFWTEGSLLISDYFLWWWVFFWVPLSQFSCSSVCLCVCYALFYPDRAFLFCPCLVIKFSLKLGSLMLERDSNSDLDYAPSLLYQFSKLPTEIGRSIFNLNHTKNSNVCLTVIFDSFLNLNLQFSFRDTILLFS